jgi:glycosyltransferase involved in cell wall biosynthesis
MPPPIRLGLLFDFAEERWPSMDLVGDMILDHMNAVGGGVAAERVRPPFRRLLSRPGSTAGTAFNADRIWNRYAEYPRVVKGLVRRGGLDLYHLVDHSYAQLVHALPPGRAVVTCHDLDTFRCLLDPPAEPRPRWFRALTRRTLTGLQKAALVACVSGATRDTLRAHGLVSDDRLAVVPNGVADEFSPDPDPAADAEAARLLGPAWPVGPPEILYVGSNIPRKRVDVLLAVFAEVRRSAPRARLVKVGGPLAPGQEKLARDLGVFNAVAFPPFLDRRVLAAVYRRAAVVLQPSEAEGFGLPVAEAMACGAAVVASDLPTLREVGGDAATYRPVGDIPAWSSCVLEVLAEHRERPDARHSRRDAGLARSSLFRWSAHAGRLIELYREVLARPLSAE